MDASRTHPGPPLSTACATRELPASLDWLTAVGALQEDPCFWWLDSALETPQRGRFSYAGADPYAVVRASGRRVDLELRRAVRSDLRDLASPLHGDPLDTLRALLPQRPAPDPAPSLPFVGGAVGYLAYELAEGWLPLAPAAHDERGLPQLCFLLVDQLLARDHLDGRLHAVALGFDDDPRVAAERAAERAKALSERVCAARPAATAAVRPSPARSLAVEALFDESAYVKTVARAQEHIAAGDVYQVCLTHRLEVSFGGDPHALYRELRATNPAPFGAYLGLPEAAILSSSPERFLFLGRDRWVESRPIKGTRPRGSTPQRDRALQRELGASAKERAENLMIVDLVRNDLGRVCEIGSVHVPELMLIEPYATVFQMVSTVRGRLRRGCDVFDLVRASFPPGSMTGAPKIAAMGILQQLEPVARGVYSGALGYLDVRGGAGLAVVIRTAVVAGGRASVNVGGGIVADSEPAAEWRESWDKARALLAALEATR